MSEALAMTDTTNLAPALPSGPLMRAPATLDDVVAALDRLTAAIVDHSAQTKAIAVPLPPRPARQAVAPHRRGQS